MNNRNKHNSFARTINKILFSAFVVFSFIGYALENRRTDVKGLSQTNEVAIPTNAGTITTATESPTSTAAASETAVPVPEATATDLPVPVTSSGYKDGTYTGPVIDVNVGNVQVQATIKNGKISNVQFLDYPQDRNTSRRINSYAVPSLQQEAIQAQSANVDIVTGATLTSEGFQMSLQAALNQAKG